MLVTWWMNQKPQRCKDCSSATKRMASEDDGLVVGVVHCQHLNNTVQHHQVSCQSSVELRSQDLLCGSMRT